MGSGTSRAAPSAPPGAAGPSSMASTAITEESSLASGSYDTLRLFSSGMRHYEGLRKIGRGSYGTVYLVCDKRDRQYYCLKQVWLGGPPAERASAELEVRTLRSLDHPSIVSYHDHFVHQDGLCLVMTYCEGGDLSQQIRQHAERREPFSEAQVVDWFVQLAMALHYVHSKGILHRDLKSQNVFLTNNFVKLGDFGIVKVLEGSITSAHTVVGTPYNMSPEVCQNQPYSYKSDVWALGCVLYELCALQQAWAGSNLLGVVYKIVQQTQPPLPALYSHELTDLVGEMLRKQPDARPSLPQILSRPFVRGRMKAFVDADYAPVVEDCNVVWDVEAIGVDVDTPPLPRERKELQRRAASHQPPEGRAEPPVLGKHLLLHRQRLELRVQARCREERLHRTAPQRHERAACERERAGAAPRVCARLRVPLLALAPALLAARSADRPRVGTFRARHRPARPMVDPGCAHPEPDEPNVANDGVRGRHSWDGSQVLPDVRQMQIHVVVRLDNEPGVPVVDAGMAQPSDERQDRSTQPQLVGCHIETQNVVVPFSLVSHRMIGGQPAASQHETGRQAAVR